jgi:hypothetical protein
MLFTGIGIAIGVAILRKTPLLETRHNKILRLHHSSEMPVLFPRIDGLEEGSSLMDRSEGEFEALPQVKPTCGHGMWLRAAIFSSIPLLVLQCVRWPFLRQRVELSASSPRFV